MANFDIGIRELKQNPSEVISRAEAGNTISVLRNGKRTSVVIRSEESTKRRWISAVDLRDALREIETDDTGWLEQHNAERDSDPIVNPWDVTP